MNLKDKVVVITGGSQGFGKALAKFLRQEGSQVIISSHEKDELEAASKELGVQNFLANVTSMKDMKRLGEYAFNTFGTIDIWINNAGVHIAPSLVEDVDIRKLRRLFDVNVFGYFLGCQLALSYMKKRNAGVIINVNSTAGLEGKPGISAYSSSKFAIKGLTESIRRELGDSNIRMYQIFPGGMQTDIYKERYPEDFHEYMAVDMVARRVVDNLKAESPENDLIIRRPK